MAGVYFVINVYTLNYRQTNPKETNKFQNLFSFIPPAQNVCLCTKTTIYLSMICAYKLVDNFIWVPYLYIETDIIIKYIKLISK